LAEAKTFVYCQYEKLILRNNGKIKIIHGIGRVYYLYITCLLFAVLREAFGHRQVIASVVRTMTVSNVTTSKANLPSGIAGVEIRVRIMAMAIPKKYWIKSFNLSYYEAKGQGERDSGIISYDIALKGHREH